MDAQPSKIYQFKITLKNIKPPVWRRIQVPENYSLWDLHVAIQDAMGWMDYHLHEFKFPLPVNDMYRAMRMNTSMAYVRGTRIGIKCDDWGDEEILDDRKEKMKKWFTIKSPKASYTYDFGDNWEHWIVLEKILPKEEYTEYPLCIKGKRQCPPEDCGGVWGFEDICNRRHHAQLQYEKIYDPTEEFEAEGVVFDDPQERWKEAMRFR
jgi:hypothetical protein